MSIYGIILATVIVGGTGILIGLFLGFSGKKFAVEVDEREEQILEALPGNNCGGCGFPGCSGLAAAIVKGEAPVNQCPVGGAPVAQVMAGIRGQEAEESERMVAFVHCAGNCDKATKAYDYTGIESCQMVSFMQGRGPKDCTYGCLGFGDCVKACQFGAINIYDGISVVDRELCKACGACVKACPRHLIDLIPYDKRVRVRCSTQEKGKAVMQVCEAGCIGCKMCEKECKFDAIHVENNIARIDYEKCKNCGACARKCPRKIITMVPKKPVAKTPVKPAAKEEAEEAPKTEE